MGRNGAKPASIGDGRPAPDTSMARSKFSSSALASMTTFVSHASSRDPLHAGVGAQVGEEALAGGVAVVEDQPRRLPERPGVRQQRRALIREQVDVGLDGLGRRLAEGEDPQRHPWVVRRDREVDRRPVADRLAALGGGVGIEGGRHEDRRALGVEVEDLGRIGGQAEAVVLGPQPNLVAATAEDRDIERVDRRLEQDLGLAACSHRPRLANSARSRVRRIGFENQPLERPVATTLDLARDVRQGRDGPEGSAASGELEAGDVVLDAAVVAGEGRRAKQVDGPVRADEAAAAENGRGGDEQGGGGRHQREPWTSHRAVSFECGRSDRCCAASSGLDARASRRDRFSVHGSRLVGAERRRATRRFGATAR